MHQGLLLRRGRTMFDRKKRIRRENRDDAASPPEDGEMCEAYLFMDVQLPLLAREKSDELILKGAAGLVVTELDLMPRVHGLD